MGNICLLAKSLSLEKYMECEIKLQWYFYKWILPKFEKSVHMELSAEELSEPMQDLGWPLPPPKCYPVIFSLYDILETYD